MERFPWNRPDFPELRVDELGGLGGGAPGETGTLSHDDQQGVGRHARQPGPVESLPESRLDERCAPRNPWRSLQARLAGDASLRCGGPRAAEQLLPEERGPAAEGRDQAKAAYRHSHPSTPARSPAALT